MSVAFNRVFKCEDHVYQGNFVLLPIGTYTGIIESSQKLKTQNEDDYLSLDFKIQNAISSTEGKEYIGRVKSIPIYMWSGSDKARDYAMNILGQIGLAVGVKEISTTKVLENKPFRIQFGVSQYDGKDRNEIVKISPAVQSEQPTKIEQPAQEQESEIDDDNIPF